MSGIMPLKKTNSVIKNNNKKNILYIMHGGGGGTPNTNKDLMSYVDNYYNCFLLVSTGKEMTLYDYSNDMAVLQKWKLNSKWLAQNTYVEEYERTYLEIFTEYSFDLVHIRQLIHHTFDLPKVCKKLGIKVVLSFHDFYLACLSYNLLNGENKYCAGKCDDNIRCRDNRVTDYPVINDHLDEWRDNVREMFLNIDYFVTTSNIVKDIFLEIYPSMPKDKFIIIEHGRDFESVSGQLFEIPSSDKPIKILFTGNIYYYKGSLLIKELERLDKDNKLEIHFLGATDGNLSGVGIHHGKYEREDLPKLIGEIKPSFMGIFSIWCETFCHTLTESWAYGIPVLCTDIGVQGERLAKTQGGWFINHEDMEETYDMILKIADDKDEYLSKINNVNNISLKSIEEMGDEYIEIYNKLVSFKGDKMTLKEKFLNKSNSYVYYKNEYEKLLNKNKKLEKKVSKLEKELNSINKKYDKQTDKFNQLNKKLDSLSNAVDKNDTLNTRLNEELLYGFVFNDTIRNSEWLKKNDFSLIKGAANYSLAYLLYRILNDASPNNILELGLGQSSKITTQYANHFTDTKLTIMDGSEDWINGFCENLIITDNIDIVNMDLENCEFGGKINLRFKDMLNVVKDEKFDFIIVDAPQGFYNDGKWDIFYEYPRSNIFELIPNNLADDFIIIFDDYQRKGEKKTARHVEKLLQENNIDYYTYSPHAFKDQLLIFTEKYRLVGWF